VRQTYRSETLTLTQKQDTSKNIGIPLVGIPMSKHCLQPKNINI